MYLFSGLFALWTSASRPLDLVLDLVDVSSGHVRLVRAKQFRLLLWPQLGQPLDGRPHRVRRLPEVSGRLPRVLVAGQLLGQGLRVGLGQHRDVAVPQAVERPQPGSPADDYRLLVNEVTRLTLSQELFTFVTAAPVKTPRGQTAPVSASLRAL